MKKFYFLLASAAVALSASAADLQPQTPVGRKVNAPMFKAAATAENFTLVPQASVKADETYTIEGSYTAYIGDYYFTNSANDVVEEIATVTKNGDKVTIDCSFWAGMELTAKFDEATNTLTFEEGDFFEVPMQSGATYYSKMVTYQYNEDATSFADAFSYTSFTATFDPATGTITVDQSGDFGIQFPAYTSDDELGETGSFFYIFDLYGLEPYVEPSGELDLTEWEDFSTATLIDGWILPAFGYEPSQYPVDGIKVMRNKDNANLLALIDPYVYLFNSANSGAIVVDVEDPEFVAVVPGVYSGMDNGTNKICCINIEGFYLAQGYDKEAIIEGVTSVEKWSAYTEEDGKTVISIPNARFNYLTAPDKAYSWNGSDGASLIDKMVSVITIDALVGVESVIADGDANAPVEYFNLQGVRVTEPANGLYIVRQGSKVAKQVVK